MIRERSRSRSDTTVSPGGTRELRCRYCRLYVKKMFPARLQISRILQASLIQSCALCCNVFVYRMCWASGVGVDCSLSQVAYI